MARRVGNVNLTLPLVLLAGAAQAATAALPAAVPPAAMDRALGLAREAAALRAPAGARVQAQAGMADPRLMLAPCADVQAYLPSGVPAWGHTRIGLRCAGGPVRWNVLLPVQVQVFAPAAVATAALPGGAQLLPDQVALREVEWSAGPQPPLGDTAGLAGRTLARALQAGQPIRAADLTPRQWFVAGETVRVVAVGAGYAVAAEGTALTPGIEGQMARVRLSDQRVLVGRAVGRQQVEVGP
mgnify:CR=1 FL=1